MWQGEEQGRPSGCFKALLSPAPIFSMIHICFIYRASRKGNVWKKSSATEETVVDHLCFRIQVKIFPVSEPLEDGNEHFYAISSAAFNLATNMSWEENEEAQCCKLFV